MAADMANAGSVVACDVRRRRMSLLQDTVRLSGAAHVHLVHLALEGALPFTTAFDRCSLNAPCSGLGTNPP